ncbi:MAG TPA: hypothetical protein VN963_08770 [bacterium]|nr:hypothetical protein [bacterium]
MTDQPTPKPDSTAIKVALWRAVHLKIGLKFLCLAIFIFSKIVFAQESTPTAYYSPEKPVKIGTPILVIRKPILRDQVELPEERLLIWALVYNHNVDRKELHRILLDYLKAYKERNPPIPWNDQNLKKKMGWEKIEFRLVPMDVS